MMELERGGFAVTKQQAAIIDHVSDNKCRVTVAAAGAGSGKTYTTVAAVIHLIGTKQASIDQFVLISFTRKAANSLREKIQSAIHDRALNAKSNEERLRWRGQQERLAAAYIGTIHGFCRQVLKLFGYLDHVAYEAKVTLSKKIRDEEFKEAIHRHYLDKTSASVYGGQSLMTDYDLVKLMGKIYESVRNQDLSFERVREWTERQPEDNGKAYRVGMAKLLEEAAKAYAIRKRKEQGLDTHDLLQMTAELLTLSDYKESNIRQLAKRYRYLFVDEFQDTDAVQKSIVEALIPHLEAVLVVGDQKQSIYAFRGTQDYLLQKMASDYMQSEPLMMNISRRPTDRFREMVNMLFVEHIGRNSNYAFLREPLEGFGEMTSGDRDPPPLVFLSTAYGEGIYRTARAIRGLLDGKHYLEVKKGQQAVIEQGDIVLLTRTNAIADAYVRGLREEFSKAEYDGKGFVVQGDSGNAFYALPEIISVTYMLQLLLTYPKDDAALTLAMDTPFLLNATQAHAANEKLRQVQKPVGGSPLSEAFKDMNPELHQELVELQSMVRVATVPQLLEHLYRAFSIRTYYASKGEEQANLNLEYLREVARNLFYEDQALTLHAFVDFLKTSRLTGREEELITPPSDDEKPESKKPPYIRVMTIHSAKGLEFPIVIVPEVQRPIIRSKEEQEPDFLIISKDANGKANEHGLEVKIRLKNEGGASNDTVSSHFHEALRADRSKLREEEMRILYVAVTRAEHCVLFIGTYRNKPYPADHDKYSWQDEILSGRPVLTQAGAIFGR